MIPESAAPLDDTAVPEPRRDVAPSTDIGITSAGSQSLPIVALGGSAGAIRALDAFFSALPPSPGMVFIVVLHLSPDHASSLVGMIRKWTSMRVVEAHDRAALEANAVYVIPPAKHLTIVDGYLEVTDMHRESGRLVTVDLLLRSLADAHGANAVAIILSGADGDGVLGIKRIKERGGLTIAQDPAEAEHAAMPRAAIATGMIDWVLPAAKMPQRLIDYVRSVRRLGIATGNEPPGAPFSNDSTESAVREILVFLRTRTRRDFSYYKRATIVRRISRRMQVNGVHEMADYLSLLRAQPGEAGALLKELLISVTNFFRDRDAFDALTHHIPELYRNKTQNDTVRLWVPGCATGEEAYSLAMLCCEEAQTHNAAPALQVFACDIDEEAVQTAREGRYPDAITADVSEDRLHRFFVKEHGGYRVRRELREAVLFASHDLLQDAPFCRVDLVSCRNLLIYLNPEAHARALDLFHFALRPDGLLFLGTAETIDEGNPLFRAVDKKNRIYARRSSPRPFTPLPLGSPPPVNRATGDQIAPEQKPADVATSPPAATGPGPASAARVLAETRASVAKKQEGTSWSELHFKLIERFGPPSVLVDRNHDIQHISESAGRFLHVTGGLPTTNLLQLVHPALRVELRGTLFRAAHTGQPAEALHVPAELDGKRCEIDLRATPASDLAPDFLLVTFEARNVDPGTATPPPVAPAVPPLPDLERELAQMKSQLRDTVEQYEASTEELKAGNEELQAMNEELRSATEELETSREELQSINEELSTVNQELKNKVDELAHANSDLQNLMSATLIATVFLDRDMRIMRFTNAATHLFNLIPSDIGRPLSDLQRQIEYPEIQRDAERVLQSLAPVEREVTGAEGRHYLSRLLPYRTVEDKIAGVVLAFVDISERERAEQALARELADTELLRKVGDQLSRDGSMQEVFDAILHAALALTQADAAIVHLIDDTHRRHLLATAGLAEQFRQDVAAGADRAAGLIHRAAVGGKRVIADFSAPGPADERDAHRAYVAAEMKSAQATPLIARNGQALGVLSTLWKQPHQVAEREFRFLDLLARQAADAIDRSRVAEELRQYIEGVKRLHPESDGREIRVAQLTRELNALARRHGEPPPYPDEDHAS